MRMAAIGWKVILVLALSGGPALAQAKKQTSRKTNVLGIWSIKMMVEQACTNIARRYNLNEQQETYTRALMANRVDRFIQEHGNEFEGLAVEILRSGVDPNNPPPKESVQQWGKKAGPLLKEIRKAILDGNAEWRQVLNEDQKKIHDFDMTQMTRTFTVMEKQFQRWQAGQYFPGEGPFTGLSSLARQSGQVGPGIPPQHRYPEDNWEYWVRAFIQRYNLDEAQSASAYAILRDCKQRATNYRESRKAEIEAERKKLLELLGSKDREAIKQTGERINRLNKPISDLFVQLKERAQKIPTESQIAAYEQKRKASGKKAQVRSKTTSKPAGSPKPPKRATIK